MVSTLKSQLRRSVINILCENNIINNNTIGDKSQLILVSNLIIQVQFTISAKFAQFIQLLNSLIVVP